MNFRSAKIFATLFAVMSASCGSPEKAESPADGGSASAGAANLQAQPGAPGVAATTLAMSRPTYNKGTGFFVLNGKLYDANGNEMRIRGVNKLHWDFASPGIPASRANTVRWNIDFSKPVARNIELVKQHIAKKIVVMPSNWTGTCKQEPSYLNTIVNSWVAQAASWRPLERSMILNIANEWGPRDSTVWRDEYIKAIRRLRAAGYNATIAVDSGGCGQNVANIVKYGKAVFDSDPQRNVIFDVHVYGSFGNGQWQQPFLPSMDSLKATGLVVVIGEFGPGRNIGPSPTMLTPLEIMMAAEARQMGWLAWAWDDDASRGDNWFALSRTGDYRTSSDLTTFGKTVIEHPTYGLLKLAKPASIFMN